MEHEELNQSLKINFDNVIQQLLSSNFKFKEDSKHYLSIKTDIRTEIEGLQNIQDYCRTNRLPIDFPQKGYNFMEKNLYIFKDGKKAIVNTDLFNFRTTFSIETLLSTRFRNCSNNFKKLANKFKILSTN